MNNLKNNNYLGADPATIQITNQPVDKQKHRQFIQNIKGIESHER